MRQLFLIFSFLGASGLTASAQLYINEFVASNTSGITDESGASEDWVEVYNAGPTAVDLANYYVSDDPANPRLWRIPGTTPSLTTVPPKGYLLLWADKDIDVGPNHVDFKLSASGESVVLTAPDGTTVIDRYTFGAQLEDVSLGRVGDGGATWDFFATPTPRAANSTPAGTPQVMAPTISQRGGLYDAQVTVSLSVSTAGAVIRYTTDGSVPDGTDATYDAPLRFSQNTPLRVRAFRAGLTPSPVVTETYLFGAKHVFPVVAYTADPGELFDPATGMYTNFEEDIEITANAELYETDNTQGFNQLFESDLQGTGSVTNPQKSLTLKAKKSLGADIIPYRVFPESKREEYRSLTLRNTGQDNNVALMRDVLTTSLVLDLTDVNAGGNSIERPDVLALRYRPSVTYINGDYWGILNIRERADRRYIDTHFDLKEDEIDFLENDEIIKNGDQASWLELQTFLRDNELTTPEAYRYVADRVDLGNFIDHYTFNLYIDNWDWPSNNYRRFRDRAEGGQWRWFTFDLDLSMGLRVDGQEWNSGNNQGNSLGRLLTLRGEDDRIPDRTTLLLRRLLGNEGFKARFVNRMADQLNVLYSKERVTARVDALERTYAPELEQHLNRWAPGLPVAANVEKIRKFADGRPEVVRQQFASQIEGLDGVRDVVVRVNDTRGGQVDWSTVTVNAANAPYSGKYFGGVAIPVSAHPNRGYVFDGWTGALGGAAPEQTITLAGDITVQANFALGSTAADVIVINEINYNSSAAIASDDWVELYNPNATAVDISGWTFEDESGQFFPIPANTMIPAGGFLVLAENTIDFKVVYPNVTKVIGDFGKGTRGFGLSGGGEMITLKNAAGTIIDQVTYDDDAPWPTAADGDGPTLQLRSPNLDNALASSWDAITATPGARNGNATSVTEVERRVGLRLSPNPATSEVQLVVNAGLDLAAVTVYNVAGQRVQAVAGGSSTRYILDVSGLADGLYLVELRLASGERVAERLVMRR